MTKIVLSACIAVSLLATKCAAQGPQDGRQYAEGPITLVEATKLGQVDAKQDA